MENEMPCPHCGKPICLVAPNDENDMDEFEKDEPTEQERKIKKQFDGKNKLEEY